jgi:peptidoglycan-associated lipoprotein
MKKGSISYRAVVSLLCLSVVIIAGGCSGKRVAASSGDASSTKKEISPAASATAPVETISPEPMVTIPDDRRPTPDDYQSTIEAAREPLPESATPLESSSERAAGTMESAPPISPSSSPSAFAATDSSSPGDIYFDFDQFVVRGDAEPVLAANAAWIKRMPDKSVLIEGHCDERGTQAYNLVLGEKRARSAKRYLEDLGVPGSRLQIISYGEVRPFCKEHDEHCYQLNRRAHFVAK